MGNYYSTMSFDAEAQIVRELGKFLLEEVFIVDTNLFMSTVEKTALLMLKLNIKIINQTLYMQNLK